MSQSAYSYLTSHNDKGIHNVYVYSIILYFDHFFPLYT